MFSAQSPAVLAACCGTFRTRPAIGAALPGSGVAPAQVDPFLPLASGSYREADLDASANCACTIAAKKGAVAPCSWAAEESQIESREHQDNANVRYQPLPESVSEERDIQTNYDGQHYHHVKRDSDRSAHFSLHGLYCK
jgi:hypothetical protein